MSSLSEFVLEKYFQSHKELIETGELDADRIVVSFPVYYSANHRVELSVMKLQSGNFHISDMGKTIGELHLAGVAVLGKTKQRMVRLAKNADVRIVGNEMVRECTAEQLGDVLHLFADSAKTIGDAYLVHRGRLEAEDELREHVKRVLVTRQYPFKENAIVPGTTEEHEVDFYIPPNGTRGLALAVLQKPTRIIAEAWAFKASDIRALNKQLGVGVVYGVETTADKPRNIITKNIEIAIPSSDLEALERGLVPLIEKNRQK